MTGIIAGSIPGARTAAARRAMYAGTPGGATPLWPGPVGLAHARLVVLCSYLLAAIIVLAARAA